MRNTHRTRRPMKPMKYPHGVEYSYRNDLLTMNHKFKLSLKKHLAPLVPKMVKEITDTSLPTGDVVRLDAWQDELKIALTEVALDMIDPMDATTKSMLKYGMLTNQNNKAEWSKLIRSQYGVDPTREDPDRFKQLLEQWARVNSLLIKDIPQKTADQIKDATIEALQSGQNVSDMTQSVFDIMSERTDVSDSRAKLIARDQVSKLNGALTQGRQRDIGVEGYIWRTVGDERVRETHQEVDGDYYSWDDPPAETDGNHPGEDYQCRCWAEPVLPSEVEFEASLLEEEDA